MFILTRETNFVVMHRQERIEVIRGTYEECMNKFIELKGKFNKLRIEAV